LARIGIGAITPAVATIDLFVGVHEEHHHGQIEIEVEQIDISVIDRWGSHANERVSQISNAFQTNNLLVKFIAVPSRDAAEDDHQRPIRLAGRHPCLIVVEGPAIFAGDFIILRKRVGNRQSANEQTE
jgi:hypothetical protein